MSRGKVFIIVALVGVAIIVGYMLYNHYTYINLTDEEAEQQISEIADDYEVSTNHVATDDYIQDQIHHMTHQKVEAAQKWHSIFMTPEAVEELSAFIDENEDRLIHYKTYREILDRWVAGDFSQVDEDHNIVWRMQDGTIGRATGILSPQEELRFIEGHFD